MIIETGTLLVFPGDVLVYYHDGVRYVCPIYKRRVVKSVTFDIASGTLSL